LLTETDPPQRLTLAITTYERPDALAAVLASVARQGVAPGEVIVADDGSGAGTGAVIGRFAASYGAAPVHHVRQPHEGFRLTRLRNLAIARASGEYVVFVDGDMLLHPEFVADHARHARHGAFTQGVRVLLDERATARVLAQPDRECSFGPLSPGLGGLRRLHALHSPWLADVMRGFGNRLIAIKGCNQGYWREDLVRVNGFDEDIVGWGPEDKELGVRLANLGVRRQSLLCGGIAFHLHHPPADRSRRAANEAVLTASLAERRTRCVRGLDGHVTGE
jgi:glycosyltransferase involved in cell wall biosynthesis